MEKNQWFAKLMLPYSRIEELKKLSDFNEKDIIFYPDYSERGNLIRNIIEHVRRRLSLANVEPIECKNLDLELRLLLEFDDQITNYLTAPKPAKKYVFKKLNANLGEINKRYKIKK